MNTCNKIRDIILRAYDPKIYLVTQKTIYQINKKRKSFSLHILYQCKYYLEKVEFNIQDQVFYFMVINTMQWI